MKEKLIKITMKYHFMLVRMHFGSQGRRITWGQEFETSLANMMGFHHDGQADLELLTSVTFIFLRPSLAMLPTLVSNSRAEVMLLSQPPKPLCTAGPYLLLQLLIAAPQGLEGIALSPRKHLPCTDRASCQGNQAAAPEGDAIAVRPPPRPAPPRPGRSQEVSKWLVVVIPRHHASHGRGSHFSSPIPKDRGTPPGVGNYIPHNTSVIPPPSCWDTVLRQKQWNKMTRNQQKDYSKKKRKCLQFQALKRKSRPDTTQVIPRPQPLDYKLAGPTGVHLHSQLICKLSAETESLYVAKSWAQVIFPRQPPKVLGLQALAGPKNTLLLLEVQRPLLFPVYQAAKNLRIQFGDYNRQGEDALPRMLLKRTGVFSTLMFNVRCHYVYCSPTRRAEPATAGGDRVAGLALAAAGPELPRGHGKVAKRGIEWGGRRGVSGQVQLLLRRRQLVLQPPFPPVQVAPPQSVRLPAQEDSRGEGDQH
ncbi:hypothetical protein AAY473_023293 [Plecturocebus cupreus]